MKRFNRTSLKRWTSDKLVRRALQGRDKDTRWDAIFALHGRGSPQTMALVRSLARSRSAWRRELAMHVAGQLHEPGQGREFPRPEYAAAETRALLFAGLKDATTRVVAAAASSFGHRTHPEAATLIAALADHPDAGVRFAAAFALGHAAYAADVEALLRLASDRDDEVRNWATFGLGTMLEIDSPAIRERLWTNAHDPDRDVRGEALVGLARRKDPRAAALLRERLEDVVLGYELEAAEELADPSLLPALQALREAIAGEDADSFWRHGLERAVAACAGTAAR